jgi:hypothetical protein
MDPKGDKLRYGKKKVEVPEKSSHISTTAISRQMHEAISKQDKDDNIGTEAVNRSTELAEDSAYVVRDTVNRVKYGHKLHSSKKEAHTAKKAADTAESSIGAVDEVPTVPKSQRSFKAQQEQTNTSWFSRWKQKQAIKALEKIDVNVIDKANVYAYTNKVEFGFTFVIKNDNDVAIDYLEGMFEVKKSDGAVLSYGTASFGRNSSTNGRGYMIPKNSEESYTLTWKDDMTDGTVELWNSEYSDLEFSFEITSIRLEDSSIVEIKSNSQ